MHKAYEQVRTYSLSFVGLLCESDKQCTDPVSLSYKHVHTSSLSCVRTLIRTSLSFVRQEAERGCEMHGLEVSVAYVQTGYFSFATLTIRPTPSHTGRSNTHRQGLYTLHYIASWRESQRGCEHAQRRGLGCVLDCCTSMPQRSESARVREATRRKQAAAIVCYTQLLRVEPRFFQATESRVFSLFVFHSSSSRLFSLFHFPYCR